MHQEIDYAILSAGEGSRLRQEGIATPKPLIKLNGIPIIERLINIFIENNAKSINIIINDLYPEVKSYLQEIKKQIKIPFNVVAKTTDSSFHSLYELLPYLGNGKFCLTTVDTLFDPKEFKEYIQKFIQATNIDACMAVTSFIDDEKPLYIETDKELTISNFLDASVVNCEYISGGIYSFTPKVINIVKKANTQGISRMRNFQRFLLDENFVLKAYPFSKIIDIDHASDISKAEGYLYMVKN